jgi:HEAT repeats
MIGGEKAFEAAIGIFKKADTKDTKRCYLFTRFFALRAALRLVNTDVQKNRVETLLPKLREDEDEDYLVRAGAAIQLAMRRQKESKEWLHGMLVRYNDYWAVHRTLRALEEYPLDEMTGDVILVIRNTQFPDHKFIAVKALGGFRNSPSVLRALGDVVRNEPNEYLRLNAITALGKLNDSRAQEDLLHALEDPNAEVRQRASKVLANIITPKGAVAAIVQFALKPNIAPESLDYMIDSLRQVDPGRTNSTEILSDEMENEDQARAKLAEKILIDLGGWAAVTRLSQRRRNLESLDTFLKESETAVTQNYNNTMSQARFSFYFAMAVNGLIVVVGLLLVAIAIQHLIQKPDDFQAWIIPGGAGVIGVLLNLGFNNPRNNAREDLATLLNVSVIFQGYLRELHQIDATFKHMYIESRDFGTLEMTKTVNEIETSAAKTLELVGKHLSARESRRSSSVARIDSDKTQSP